MEFRRSIRVLLSLAFLFALVVYVSARAPTSTKSARAPTSTKSAGPNWRPDNYNDKASVAAFVKRMKALFAKYKDGGPEVRAMFARWKADFNKKYKTSAQEATALSNWVKNLKRSVDINTDSSKTWVAGLSKHSDLSYDQFSQSVLMKGATTIEERLKEKASHIKAPQGLVGTVPDSVDWVAAGKVTDNQRQGSCGACWAFATTAAVESAVLISTGTRANETQLDLSEDQLIKCVNTKVNASFPGFGCGGGWADVAMSFIATYGQASEATDPYSLAWNGLFTPDCDVAGLQANKAGDGSAKLAQPAAFSVPPKNADALMQAVAQQPVVIYWAAEAEFYFYQGGVYSPATCGTAVNHVMTLVGYDKTRRVWKAKNSWTSWGDNGYIEIAMEDDGPGLCGMYQYAYYPSLNFTWLPLAANSKLNNGQSLSADQSAPGPQPAATRCAAVPSRMPSAVFTATPRPPTPSVVLTATPRPPTPSTARTAVRTMTRVPTTTRVATATVTAQARRTVQQVLMIGNGIVDANGLTGMVQKLAAAASRTLFVDSATKTAANLAQHVLRKETLDKIASRAWDVVVLQEQSQIPTDQWQRTSLMYPAVRKLNSLIAAKGARTMLFETWGRQSGMPDWGFFEYSSMQNAVSIGYAGIRQELGVATAPVGMAWQIVVTNWPAIPLWSDGAMPSVHGTYLAACVFHVSLFGTQSMGNTFVPSGISAADAARLQQAADTAVLADPARFGLPI